MLLLAYRHSSLLSSKHMKRSLQTNDLCLYYPLTIPSLRHSPLHNIRYGIKEYVKDGVNYVKPRQTENIIKITNRHISIMHISITRITNKLISSIIKITNRHISNVLPVIMRIIYNISMNI